MRILHVGYGFYPWRHGGLIAYAEDLMTAQVAAGHRVAYFFAGRHYPRVSGPRLKHWRRDGVEMYEVLNGPIVSFVEFGTRRPDLDVSEPLIEAAFRRVLRDVGPDVVHIQELVCLPSSLLEIARDEGVATLMTLQDYQPLCSTLRLFDASGKLCTRLEVGADCEVRNANAPLTRAPLVGETLNYEVRRWQRRAPVVPRSVWDRLAGRLCALGERQVLVHETPAEPLDAPAGAFQRRRDVNVERLGAVDRLVAQSPRVAEIYRERGVSGERMAVLPFTLAHIEQLRPRAQTSSPSPITFATLGGCASFTKGSQVILDALRRLGEDGLEGRFRLRVFGGIQNEVRDELEAHDGVTLEHGYDRHDLDRLLDGVDVGIMPSVWEEAFGYAGLEMLAKGIPLIANPLGGIVAYAREGETAWLNTSCTGHALAELMARLIADPGLVVEMNTRVLAARDELITPMPDHVASIESLYREAAAS